MLLLGQRNIRRVKAQVVANSLSKNEVMLLKLMSEFHACTLMFLNNYINLYTRTEEKKMRNAQVTKQVTFDEAIRLMEGIRRSNLVMGYRFINYANDECFIRPTKVSAIYRDWYWECDCCPPNDTVVTHLHILLPSHVALDVVESVQFGTLMEAIEEFTVGSKYRDS